MRAQVILIGAVVATLLMWVADLWAYDGYCWTVPLRAVVRVLDGDTFEVRLDVWLNLTASETIRVLGVDAPERHGATKEAGEAARIFTVDWLAGAGELTVTACRRDSFGRVLGMVDAEKGSLAAALLREGHAVTYERRR